MFQITLFYFCVIVLLSVEVASQVCEKRKLVTSVVRETYLTHYIESYHGQCYYGCIKTRHATSVSQRYVPKSEWKITKFCCTGYIRKDDSSNDSDIVCEPICMPACKNGVCTSPGKCICLPGYNSDPGDEHNCLPECKSGCTHGTCIGPNSCRCDFGYSLANGLCVPVCTEPCHNGTCTAPETCECLPGYRKSERNLCEPYCSNGCDNGFCTAPETCSCKPDWTLIETTVSLQRTKKTCKPVCLIPCDHGYCVAPNVCECLPSFRKLHREMDSDVCVPDCLPGWDLEGDSCVPKCSSCDNGVCVVPNVCICHSGYHMVMDNDLLTCVPEPDASSTSEEASKHGTEKSQDTTSINEEQSTIEAYDDYSIYLNEYDDTNYKDFTSETSVVNPTRSSNINVESAKQSWIQQHWMSIFIPLLIIFTAAIIMLFAWRWTPIIVYFKGRSYVVEGDPPENNGSYPFQDIQITSTNEKETKESQNKV